MRNLELDHMFGDVMKVLEGISIKAKKKVEPALIIEHEDDRTIINQLQDHIDEMHDQIELMNSYSNMYDKCLGCSRPACNDH